MNQTLPEGPSEINQFLLVLRDQITTLANETKVLIKLHNQNTNAAIDSYVNTTAISPKNITSLAKRSSSDMDQRVKDHVIKVYRHLAIMSATAAIGALTLTSGLVTLGPAAVLVVFLISLVSVFGFIFSSQKLLFSLSTALTSGMITALIALNYAAVGIAALPYALGGTVLIFGSFTLAAFLAPSTSFLRWGGTLIAIMIATLLVAIMNIFLAIPALSGALAWAFMVIYSIMIGYDTQKMITRAQLGYTDYMTDAFSLFQDLAVVLQELLTIIVRSKLKLSDK